MTEQEDKAITTSSPPEIKATTTTPAESAVKPTPKAKAGSSNRKKPAAKAKPKAAIAADLNSKDFPLHPERIWPD